MRTPAQSGVRSPESGVRHFDQKGSENPLFKPFSTTHPKALSQCLKHIPKGL